MGSSSTESEPGISEMIEALSGLLQAELGPGRAVEEARSLASSPGTVAGRTTELGPGRTMEVQSPAPDTGADHKFDEDDKITIYGPICLGLIFFKELELKYQHIANYQSRCINRNRCSHAMTHTDVLFHKCQVN